ncbi:MAG TPA: anhydro-N-acetylmuramic acid kinase [Nitrospiraceae bacterium]|jgi:anhydro-N-acetylmuramic acid kinase|nr:anhydro-N-acetylmuramic acid kinase [Nitrospiraceae bacterium]
MKRSVPLSSATIRSQNVIGLMSGTSGDGVDAALVEIQGEGDDVTVVPVAFRTVPYARRLRDRILAAAVDGRVSEICHLNAVLGEWFAKAALALIDTAGYDASDIDLIGSHGHTIHHLPRPTREAGIPAVRSTLQIGEPSVIAERTGITTVADFRPRDIAAGGQGAPLASYAHYVLFRDPKRSRLVVNLGGIGNVTYLPAGNGLDAVQAFDTGPGNMVLDGLAHHFSGGRQAMDRNGRLAATGRVDRRLLRRLLSHPFLRKRPPKSTGREDFGSAFIAKILAASPRRQAKDVLATCSLFTAMTVGTATRWLSGPVDDLVVGGGGARNATLMADMAAVFEPVPVRRFEDVGWDSKAFEAIAFALLAYQTAHGRPGNVPTATGAKRVAVLGKIIPGRREWTFS